MWGVGEAKLNEKDKNSKKTKTIECYFSFVNGAGSLQQSRHIVELRL